MGTPQLHALTTPLITTSSGEKMGKTASGAVWLNADMKSPYEYWQFWRNTEDADVPRFLKLFTTLPMNEIEKLASLEGAEINEAKKALADAATTLLHGADAARQAADTARQTFEEGAIAENLPTVDVSRSELHAGLGVLAASAPGRPVTGAPHCQLFPSSNPWNQRVDKLPVASRSSAIVKSIGLNTGLHPDFGSFKYGNYGIPYTTVGKGQRKVAVSFDYAEDSDRGPYPVPRNALVEGGPNAGGDRHVLVVDTGACRLYELWDAHPAADGSWHAGSGAVFDLRGNKLRPAGLTSADAAGLPVVPGLVRYEEVAAGRIDHAIRITVPHTQKKYLWPARHFASSSTDATLPPMGLRLRLKAGIDISRLPSQARVIAQAMKTYGVIVADNGSAWYVSGAPDDRWNNDALRALAGLHGGDFEAVDANGLLVDKDSAAYKQ